MKDLHERMALANTLDTDVSKKSVERASTASDVTSVPDDLPPGTAASDAVTADPSDSGDGARPSAEATGPDTAIDAQREAAVARLAEVVAASEDFEPEPEPMPSVNAQEGETGPDARPSITPALPALVALFAQLDHDARGDVTEVRATSASGAVSVGYFASADSFAAAVAEAMEAGSSVTVGVQPRPQRLYERAPDRFVIGAEGAAPEHIAHVTTLAVTVEPVPAVQGLVARAYKTTSPLTASVGTRGLILSALPPVTVNESTRDDVTTRLLTLADQLAQAGEGASVRLVTGLAEHVDITAITVTSAPARSENAGLGALLATPDATYAERVVIDVRLDGLIDGPHYRGDLEKVDVSDLTASLPAGQTSPIIVRPLPDGRHVVLAGHRRVRAARKLGWSTLRAEVRRCSDDEAQRLAIDDALARRDLPRGQHARAIAMRKELYERAHPETLAGASGKGRERGCTPCYTAMVASMADISPSAVRRLARLGAGACDEVIAALDAGDVSASVAERIAKLALSEQPLELAAVLAAKGAEMPIKERRLKTAHAVQAAIAKAVTAAREDDEMLAEGMLAATRSVRDFFSDVIKSLSEKTPPTS